MDIERSRLFVKLLGEHERRLNAFVFSLAPRWGDADEIVQQTRIRLWEQFAEYDADKDFGAWARAIAYYQVLTHRKRQGRLAPQLSDGTLAQLAETAATLATEELQPRRRALTACLELLEEKQRRLLGRCYGGEETIEQVAHSLGRTSNSVRQALFRLRVALRDCIERSVQQVDQ